MNKVLLINPPYYASKENINFWPSFPLGIAYIASYLESNGYKVKVIDAFGEGYENRRPHDEKYLRIGLDEKEILSEVSAFRPDIIGIGNLFSIQRFSMHSMAKVIKDFDRRIPVVVGGPHVSAVPELVMSDTNIDYSIIGEGEHALRELVEALSDDKPLDSISGLAYRQGDSLKINRTRKFVGNLDELPFPAWHLFKMDKYINQKVSQGGDVRRHPVMTMLSSRGCPFNCLFCSGRDTWGTSLRVRSPENVIKEIMLLREKFGIRELIIVDDNFNFDVKRLNTILDFLIKKKMDLILQTPSGLFIQKLSCDILRKMKAAGFYRIFLPIESGSEHVRNAIIRKPIDMEHVKELVKCCREIGIDTTGYFILGLPGETKEEMMQTFKVARDLKIQPYFSVATPFPGSDLYKFAKEKGVLKSYEIEKCSDEYNISTSEWKAEELRRMLKRELLRFKYKVILISYIKDPTKFFKKIYQYISKAFK
ncbi:MAG TPA: cobalamin-dependent protein [Candidatus Omnitrophota bacterium]|nr:cobalamin-dependent protein [Candidatus Omnitrophota bacterium]